MIKRHIYSKIKNFYKETNKALLITGARQVGKTYTIRQFGKTFENFVEINFLENPETVNIFKNYTDSKDIIRRITLLSRKPLQKHKSLIFFDEVQLCPEIVTAIKFLVDEGSFRYIMSGSLLGVELKDLRSEPVGYMGVMEMFPLDLKEFLTAIGVSDEILETLQRNWDLKKPVDTFIHNQILNLYRLYLVVGGMPAVVDKYLKTNNLRIVIDEQQDIINLYLRDISQYAPQKDKLNIKEIFKLIPSELDAKNKRFILKNLNEHAKFKRYEEDFLWLTDAGVALPTYNVEEPKLPLLLSKCRNLFKLFQNDVGLLASQYVEGIQLKIINGDNNINNGAIYENAVAQELKAHGFDLYYYNNKKRGEIDFLIEIDGKVLPIEVKSGKDFTIHRALSNIMEVKDFDLKEAIVLCNDNLRIKDKIIYAPVYMVMFIKKKNYNSDIIYKPSIVGL